VALLWGGGVSDSDYNNKEGYLQEQTGFAENDRVGEDGKLIPFTNGLDKGYRAKMVAWKNGKQIAIQPPLIQRVIRDLREGKQYTLAA